ncbi:MAG: 3-methyl-2-oxobutanoate dehydrogenase subunit VorB, partial [Candidatus Omnitrophota bacterium]
MNASNKKILLTGNEAIAQAAIDGGCDFYAGYPITPQNELTAYMAKEMPCAGRIFLQAESELSAVSMIMGAASGGKRVMTSSSSPGISLKQEGISYLAGAELPALIVNVMRGGPGLGNIAPAQSDYFQAVKGGGHGDYHCIVLAPASVQESYHLVLLGFELADKYRTPLMILSDGMLGQMAEPVIVSANRQPPTANREPNTWALTGCRGRRPNIVKSFFMRNEELEGHNKKLQEKYTRIRQNEQRAEQLYLDDAEVVLVAYGSMARICRGIVCSLRKQGRKAGLIRPISLWPFPQRIFDELLEKRKPRFLVVEMSYGQMVEDVRL